MISNTIHPFFYARASMMQALAHAPDARTFMLGIHSATTARWDKRSIASATSAASVQITPLAMQQRAKARKIDVEQALAQRQSQLHVADADAPVDPALLKATHESITQQMASMRGQAASMTTASGLPDVPDYFKPVTWAHFTAAQADELRMSDEFKFWSQSFRCGGKPFTPRPTPFIAPGAARHAAICSSAQRPAMDTTNSMQPVNMHALPLVQQEKLHNHVSTAAMTRDSGQLPAVRKHGGNPLSDKVKSITDFAELDRHIAEWTERFSMASILADGSIIRRLSNVKQMIWFYMGARGVSPWRHLLSDWDSLPSYVKDWETKLLRDFITWYASSVTAYQSVNNMFSDVKEWWKKVLHINVPDIQEITGHMAYIKLHFARNHTSAKLRPSLPTYMVMCLITEAIRQRDNKTFSDEVRIRASSVLVCMTAGRQAHMRIGNIAVGSKWDRTTTPQPLWSFLSMFPVLHLEPGSNAYVFPPAIKTTGAIASEPFPFLYQDEPWNFVQVIRKHFQLLDLPTSEWGQFPIAPMDRKGTSMPSSFVCKWVQTVLSRFYPAEIQHYKIGIHSFKISGQTLCKFLGMHTSIRSRIGQWSSAAALQSGNDKEGLANLYGRTIREVIVESQRYLGNCFFSTVEWAGFRTGGHDTVPPVDVQTKEETDERLRQRHHYMYWAQQLQSSTTTVELDGGTDEEIADLELIDHFDFSSKNVVSKQLETIAGIIGAPFDSDSSSAASGPPPSRSPDIVLPPTQSVLDFRPHRSNLLPDGFRNQMDPYDATYQGQATAADAASWNNEQMDAINSQLAPHRSFENEGIRDDFVSASGRTFDGPPVSADSLAPAGSFFVHSSGASPPTAFDIEHPGHDNSNMEVLRHLMQDCTMQGSA